MNMPSNGMRSLTCCVLFTLLCALMAPLPAQSPEQTRRDIARAVIAARLDPPAAGETDTRKKVVTLPGAPAITGIARKIALDPRVAKGNVDARSGNRTGNTSWGNERSSAMMSEIVGQRANMQVARFSDAAQTCATHSTGVQGSGNQICKFRDFHTLLALSDPVVNGDSATIEMFVWSNPSDPQPGMRQRGQSSSVVLFGLVRSSGAWKVVSQKSLLVKN